MNTNKSEVWGIFLSSLLVTAGSGSAAPPSIRPTAALQHQAVDIGKSASFKVTATGDAPLAFQWWLDGRPLAGQTDATLALSAAQASDEGNYTVVVTNALGAATSEPVRLWVVPRASAFTKGNFTNSQGRLPYFYLLPNNYSTLQSYPLEFLFHGTPGDESMITNASSAGPGYANYPGLKALASYQQQQSDPMILLWPTRRAGDESWTDSYLRQALALLDQFISRFSVDTNRIYIVGGSEGVHAAWDVIAMRPGLFAGAMLAAGWPGTAAAASLKSVPVWAWCAADDGLCPNTRQLIRSLRLAGRSVSYTEYSMGGHLDGILMGCSTPALLNWLLSQRRGTPSITEPLLTISSPTDQGIWFTGGTNLALSGSAKALGQNVTRVAWENTTSYTVGPASGSNAWAISSIPLRLNRTNLLIITGTTTSWAPAYAGNTTFNATLSILSYPITARFLSQGTTGLLTWTGGGPPYRIQHATDLLAPEWADFLLNARSPVIMSPTNSVGFFRLIGQ
jgi:poly(3-hydroxybutyrate) depolymerase